MFVLFPYCKVQRGHRGGQTVYVASTPLGCMGNAGLGRSTCAVQTASDVMTVASARRYPTGLSSLHYNDMQHAADT